MRFRYDDPTEALLLVDPKSTMPWTLSETAEELLMLVLDESGLLMGSVIEVDTTEGYIIQMLPKDDQSQELAEVRKEGKFKVVFARAS